MTASEIAALSGITERTIRRRIVEWQQSGRFVVRVIPPPFGKGRTRYVVDATEDELLFALAGLPMAA